MWRVTKPDETVTNSGCVDDVTEKSEEMERENGNTCKNVKRYAQENQTKKERNERNERWRWAVGGGDHFIVDRTNYLR